MSLQSNLIFTLTAQNNYSSTLTLSQSIFANFVKITCSVPVVCYCSIAKQSRIISYDINGNSSVTLNKVIANITDNDFQAIDIQQIQEITLTLINKPLINNEIYNITLILKN